MGATLAALLSACGYSAANDCQCQAAAAALDGLPLTECWAHRRALAADLVAAWQRRTGRPARCRHHAAAVLLVVCAIAAAGLAVYWRGQR